MQLKTDVLVIGAGGAGMYAALAAAADGANVLLVDKNLIGRGGATVMAQMTVAAALSEAEPDRWEDHLTDTLEAGRGLCDEALAAHLCEHAPQVMREMDDWGVGWARSGEAISQVHAPGHGVKRCCYVDFLNTGPAVAGTLRKRVGKTANIRKVSDLQVVDLIIDDGQVVGAAALHTVDGSTITIAAKATVIATGGLTKLYARSSASSNMGGQGFALALRAGAELTDMEFVQFFPIGHLAPRMVGMDPIMWDPFRYKLGGRLLNGQHQEFIDRYGSQDDGNYRVTRDVATYAIMREVEAGRGSPAGGAYLSFTHIGEQALRDAFGPVIDRIAKNGIDLTKDSVEVSPIAHYHMGGIRVDLTMATCVPGLFAAGEAVGGAGGANRLSGNAITEALVFGKTAGVSAAKYARSASLPDTLSVGEYGEEGRPSDTPSATFRLRELREMMWRDVGPFRTAERLESALAWISTVQSEQAGAPQGAGAFANELVDWHDLQAALTVAESIAAGALAREESRGAHQRDDFPHLSDAPPFRQNISLANGHLTVQSQLVGSV